MNSPNVDETGKLIVIIGFMGSGKTTVTRELARLLNCHAIDLDELISARENRSPGEIIEQSGEDEFRRIETETLRQVLIEQSDDSSASIIALGGGTWILPENRELIAQYGASTVWLDAPFELCWQRILTDAEARPLAVTREMAEKLGADRRPVYALANVRMAVSSNLTAVELAAVVANAVGL
jgi:shikimate kinase